VLVDILRKRGPFVISISCQSHIQTEYFKDSGHRNLFSEHLFVWEHISILKHVSESTAEYSPGILQAYLYFLLSTALLSLRLSQGYMIKEGKWSVNHMSTRDINL